MNIKSKKYCKFCDKDKIESGGHIFCPNGHYIVHKEEFERENFPVYIEELQPRSDGLHIEGEDIYRLKSFKGEFCDDTGKPVSENKKTNVLKQPEVE